ncbi:MAG: hypothetical protein K1X57_20435 [Gemmataceae bacterium]|nr:hypothetical protein [Gemmataceae bacterium]
MRTAIALLGLLAIAGTASARPVYFEVGDAGDLPVGALPVDTDSGALTSISGATDGGADIADFYLIDIKDPALFSARTDLNVGTMGDSFLCLFNLNGTGIVMSDDIDGSNFMSHITAGSVSSIAPGQYLLLVTGFGVLPAWDTPLALSSLIFPFAYPGVYAAQSPNPMIGYLNGGIYGASFGSYTVDLTGASFVPTPGAAALVGLGGLLAARRRRA